MNAYGGMLTVLTTIDSVRQIKPRTTSRVVTVLVLAVAWYAIAASINSGSVATVFSALTLMLYILVPWTATNLVDFFIVRRGHYAITDLFTPRGIYGAWGWRGLTAFGAGLLAEIPFMVLPTIGGWSYVGPGAAALGEVDIAWLVGLVVASAAYLLVSRSLDRAAEDAERHRSDERLASQDSV
jgi:purine-cytosine permease-like protein